MGRTCERGILVKKIKNKIKYAFTYFSLLKEPVGHLKENMLYESPSEIKWQPTLLH